MNKQQLESFLTIVEIGSISRASEVLYISQSTLSDRLKSLEQELGFTLINRGPGIKQIELTDRGTEFLDYTNRFLALDREIQEWRLNDHQQSIRVGAPASVNSYFLRGFYQDLLIDRQHLQLEISAHWNRTIYSMVNLAELDFGIVSRPYHSQNIETIPLMREPVVFAYDRRYSDYQNLDQLAVRDQISIEWGPAYQLWAENYWNLDEQPRVRLDSPELLMAYLESKNAWASMPLCIWQALNQTNPHVQQIVSHHHPYRELFLIYHQSAYAGGQQAYQDFRHDLYRFILACDQKDLCQSLLSDVVQE
ncbi:LysR family transcriptional regulator [Hutsoniella sourekii]|uniref:LysR family transcriptional regulator n=1 Tax=Hutsoniella sourekii TaxID=87650 RepID=UPI00048724D8|nr:LysR family transcriptional regulator [Hutsoniella sourekii]